MKQNIYKLVILSLVPSTPPRRTTVSVLVCYDIQLPRLYPFCFSMSNNSFTIAVCHDCNRLLEQCSRCADFYATGDVNHQPGMRPALEHRCGRWAAHKEHDGEYLSCSKCGGHRSHVGTDGRCKFCRSKLGGLNVPNWIVGKPHSHGAQCPVIQKRGLSPCSCLPDMGPPIGAWRYG